MSRTLVIAECGSCHDGSLKQAERLIEAAATAGVDIAKFQWWSDADRLADRRQVPDTYREIYRRYQVPQSWLPALRRRCDSFGLEFMATSYLPEDVPVVGLFVKRFKVASFEATDRAFVDACQQCGPVIVSVGMMSEPEWLDLLRHLRAEDACLQCVSSYPAAPEQMNLGVLRIHAACRACDCCGQDNWRPLPGLSDHSRDLDMGAYAVCAGAEIIEAHLRLDDTDRSNPDYAVAFTPSEFAEYVRRIRRAEVIMGSGEKTLQECERPMAAYRVRG
jgi:sialic acid synthase SpsE